MDQGSRRKCDKPACETTDEQACETANEAACGPAAGATPTDKCPETSWCTRPRRRRHTSDEGSAAPQDGRLLRMATRAATDELPVGAPATDRRAADRRAARAGVVFGQRRAAVPRNGRRPRTAATRTAEARTASMHSASVHAVAKAWARSEAARREQEQRRGQRHGSTTSWLDGAAMRRHRRRASPSARSWHVLLCN